MPYIANKPGTAYRSFTDKDTFTGDGSTVAFDMTYAIAEAGQNDLQVFVNDVRQIPGDDYTLGVDDTGEYKRITFTSAPTNSHAIVVLNPGTVQGEFSSVADNAVTTAKLFDGAVTTAKITDANVTTAKIAADAIDGTKIADDAIDSEHITDGSVDNVHLAGSIANDKLANSSITINGTSIALGASGDIVAGLDWQAVKTSSFTAVAGEGYFVNTSGGAVTVTLPASPSIGDFVGIVDYGGNASTNNITIARNGSNIQGSAEDRIVSQVRASEVYVYSDSTEGWTVQSTTLDPPAFLSATGGTVTTDGNYKIHTFTSSGCFTVSSLGNQNTTAEYLVVAGGGSGGSTCAGGGGGAGGYRTNYPSPDVAGFALAESTYPITIGGGASGVGPSPGHNQGNDGSNSVFSTITSTGGGGGGGTSPTPNSKTGRDGGSGGGGSWAGNTGGSGNTPPVSPPQGNPGGNSSYPGPTTPDDNSGGGGGASAAGTPGNLYTQGGAGSPNAISGTATSYAGGGGGGSRDNPGAFGGVRGPLGIGQGGAGGGGGGGVGRYSGSRLEAENGTANTGGGGGGANRQDPSPGVLGASGSGGSGIVIIRYKYQ